MTPEEKQKVIEALEDYSSRAQGRAAQERADEALAIMRGDISTREPVAWIVHATNPWVTMDPPIEGGLPRTPLYQ